MDREIFKLAKYLHDNGLEEELDNLKEIVERLQSHTNEPNVGQHIRNINPNCKHFGSEGVVLSLGELDDDMGITATYEVSNSNDDTYRVGDILTKTLDQLELI